jgi:ATP-binding cassette, subfamily B, bacterial
LAVGTTGHTWRCNRALIRVEMREFRLVDLSAAHYWRFLSTYLRPLRGRVLVLALLLFGSVGLQLVSPQIVRTFIDAAQAGSTGSTLSGIAVLYFGVAVVTQVVAVGETYAAENVGWLATNALRADLARHCLELDLSFHTAHSPGELIERIDGDVSALANFFSRFVLRILGNGVLLAGVLALLFREDWRVGLALLVFVVIAMTFLVGLSRIGVRFTIGQRRASAELFGFLEERLDGRVDLQAIGAHDHVMAAMRERLGSLAGRAVAAARISGGLGAATTFLFAGGTVLALGLGGLLYLRGEATLGTIYLLFQYTAMLSEPLGQITRDVQDFQSAGASLVRAQQLLKQPRRLCGRANDALPLGPLTVALDHVSFGYDSAKLVLHDVSLQVEPGEVVGLLGRTGSGKSTIARLLFRHYDPDKGVVRLDGIDLRDLRLDELPARVGLVTQEVQLFRATLRENLSLFDSRVADARLHETLGLLGLAEWYGSLPSGLDTELGAGGVGVSAGQAQLLAFARVFLKDPGLVILDEASSRLDPATERLVEAATDRLLLGRTAIIIAHRLTTIARVDSVVILDDGQIVEAGPRAALTADPRSHLAKLLRTAGAEVLA